MSSIASSSAVSNSNNAQIAVLQLMQNAQKIKGDEIKSLIEGAQIDMPNENGTISMLA